jgi:hypothetical protein
VASLLAWVGASAHCRWCRCAAVRSDDRQRVATAVTGLHSVPRTADGQVATAYVVFPAGQRHRRVTSPALGRAVWPGSDGSFAYALVALWSLAGGVGSAVSPGSDR